MKSLTGPPAQPTRHHQPTANVTQADLAWAAAMTDVATRYSAELPNLPPAQQQPHLARIRALTNIAAMLGKGEAPRSKPACSAAPPCEAKPTPGINRSSVRSSAFAAAEPGWLRCGDCPGGSLCGLPCWL